MNKVNVASAASMLFGPSIYDPYNKASISDPYNKGAIKDIMDYIKNHGKGEKLECAKNYILEAYCAVKKTDDYVTVTKIYFEVMDNIVFLTSVRNYLDASATVAEIAEELASAFIDEALELGVDDAPDILEDAAKIANSYVAGRSIINNILVCCGL